MLEVTRRGIPTVRGLSAGHHGAAGDLGLLVACRLLQDGFRTTDECGGLLTIYTREEGDTSIISLLLPVDPFRAYLDDLQRAIDSGSTLRPDLIAVGIRVSPSTCRIRLTPIEVKFRSGVLDRNERIAALEQAKSLSLFFKNLQTIGQAPEMVMWRLAYQHFLVSLLSFGFRVYSQQRLVGHQSKEWASDHARIIRAIYSDEAILENDETGRLIVLDNTLTSKPDDVDGDAFNETIVLSGPDAASVLMASAAAIVEKIKHMVGTWRIMPQRGTGGTSEAEIMPFVPTRPEPIGGVAPMPSPAPGIIPASPPAAMSPPEAVMPVAEVGAHPLPPSAGERDTASGDSGKEAAIVSNRGIEFQVGQAIDNFANEPRLFNPSDTRLNQLNMGVVGDLGTGKTQFLKAFIFNMIKAAPQNRGITPRFLIFDYKRDYISGDFVQDVNARIIKPWRLPLNLFDTTGIGDALMPWLDRYNFFADVLEKIYSCSRPVQRQNLRRVVRDAYVNCGKQGRQPTIYDVHAGYQALVNGRADTTSEILDNMVTRELFSSDPGEHQAFDKFFEGVVVIDLAALGQDDNAKNMIVALMLNMFYEHMLRIPKRPYQGATPQTRVVDSYLLVDEANNIMKYNFYVLSKVLLQGREFGVGVILASQYLSHFRGQTTDYRAPLLTWFIHKVPNILPTELSALGMNSQASEMVSRVKALPNHWCLYKSYDGQGEFIEGIPYYKLRPRPLA